MPVLDALPAAEMIFPGHGGVFRKRRWDEERMSSGRTSEG